MTLGRGFQNRSSAGELRVSTAAGTAAAADVAIAGMVVGDELVAVIAVVTAAAGANTPLNRTAEYNVQAGGLNKPAGTDDSASSLWILWRDLT